MGRPTGLEPATPRFTILCSNQLSYDRRKGRRKSGAGFALSTFSSEARLEARLSDWHRTRDPKIHSAGPQNALAN